MSNFLEETIEDIKESGHKIEDIIFIGSVASGHQCTWDEFKILANREYDSGFGALEVATDLIIVFSDKIVMRRDEYGGSEWWEYQKPFVMPKESKKIKTLFPDKGHTLEEDVWQ
jgi:hypothetical protein